jgi:hypothetical protein
MIKRKSDVINFIEKLEDLSNWDGNKYYFKFNTENPNGTITMMKYVDGKLTVHRKNELYWDIAEHEMNTNRLINLIWKNRKMINRVFKRNNEKVS